jgi:multicomponent Na+:H+ antiporter subunit D
MKELVPLLVALPLGTAFLVVVLAHIKAVTKLTGPLTVLAVAANLVLACLLWTGAGTDSSAVVSIWGGGWDGSHGPLGIQLVSDGLARMMALVINLVALAIAIFAAAYMQRFTTLWLFRSLFLVLVGSVNGVVLSGDLFNMYVFIEVSAVASYALVAYGCEGEELEASFKYLTLGVVASTLILAGIAVIYSLTGQLNMAKVAEALKSVHGGAALPLAASCLLAGLAIKAAMVPFHAWLPDAHPSAPAPISAMLSGIVIKAAGVYAMTRVVFNVLGADPLYAYVLIGMGVASMVIGALMSLGQSDLKRLLAYSSVSQMGYVVMAVGASAALLAAGNREIAALCLFGGLFHMFNHAIFKSLLFLTSGSIEHATGTRMLDELGGLRGRMPLTSLCCRVGMFSIAGVPPFNGFFSKLIIIIALVLGGFYVLAFLAAGVAVVTLLITLKVQRTALDGAVSAHTESAGESPWPMGLGMAMLALLCVAASLAALPAVRGVLFDPACKALLGGVQ